MPAAQYAVRSGQCLLGHLDDDSGDFVRIRVGSRAAVFQATLPAVLDGADRDPDRCAAVGDTVAVLVDRLGLVQAGQALLDAVAVVLDDQAVDLRIERS